MTAIEGNINSEESFLEKIGGWVFAIPVTILIAATCSFCDMKLWNWFVVPFFHAPHMTILMAMGLGLIIKLCQQLPMDPFDKEPMYYLKYIGRSIKIHYEFLLIGFILHLFM